MTKKRREEIKHSISSPVGLFLLKPFSPASYGEDTLFTPRHHGGTGIEAHVTLTAMRIGWVWYPRTCDSLVPLSMLPAPTTKLLLNLPTPSKVLRD